VAEQEGNKLQAQVEVLRAKAKGREAVEVELPAPVGPAKKVQLPIWPEPVRGVPNSVLRSALFGAIRRGKRAFQQRVPLASVDGVTILFTGPRLDQADLDVWEQCLHLARSGGLGCRVQFAAHGFLKSLNRNASGANHEWLKNAFARLASSVVEIKDGKRAYFGPMIHHGTRDDETGQYAIEINPAIVALYGSDGWSQVEWEQRKALKRQPLAQWLHGFYTTHAAPFPYKVETLHRLCGSEAKLVSDYRKDLRAALDKLATATGWAWEIDNNDLVRIEKRPSASQTRNLIHRAVKNTG
jgi:hypothetical protein